MGGVVRRVVGFCELAHTSALFFRTAGTGVLLAAAAFELCITFNLGGARFALAVDDIGTAAAALIAGVACAVAACRTRGSGRLGWALLAASALSWSGGEIIWSFIEIGLGQVVPSPSPADIGFLLMVPFGFAGVVVLAGAAGRRSESLRALIDGLLIASSLLLVSWEAVLRSTFADSSLSVLGKLVNLSYPVSDIAMLTVVVVALTRVSRGSRTAVGLLGGGLICIAVADSAFAYVTAATHFTATLLDGGWFAGYLMIALASLRADDIAAANEQERLGGPARMIAPYVAILLAVATGFVIWLKEGQLVLGFAELLLGQRRGDLNQFQERYVSNIVASGKHLLSLINDVLDLSRVASGEIEVVAQRVAVEEAIAEAVAQVRPLADRKSLRLFVEQTGRPKALADPLRLQQIVLNLLSNAVKFTPRGGRVDIRSRSAGFVVEIEVSDSGIGIPTEHLSRIFEEYSQVDDAYSRNQEGTGLGLAVSRRLAELMSATLTVESELGSGSVFRLRLPAASVIPAEDTAGGGEGHGRPDGEAEEVAAEAAQA